MVYFQTKNPNLGKFRSVLERKMLVNFMAIWSISLPYGIFYGHLVYFVAILVPIFFPFWYAVQRKIWQPCRAPKMAEKMSKYFV
jgi:hypothetical protein